MQVSKDEPDFSSPADGDGVITPSTPSLPLAGFTPGTLTPDVSVAHSLNNGDDGGSDRTISDTNGGDVKPPQPASTEPSPSLLQQSPRANGHRIANAEANANGDKPVKPKQKRNKPTLSCLECVERKTKCDRGRPCLACVKRQSSCEYTAVANLIASADRKNGTGASKARYVTKPPNKIRKTSHSSSATSPIAVDWNGWSSVDRVGRSSSAQNGSSSSPHMLSNVPYTNSKPSNVFGIGSQHPFSNYWTCQGGLPEVISVLPSKDQADILVAKYFDCFDPVYPFIHRRTFYADYERFWASPLEEKHKADAATMALHYAIYALGTQFVQFPTYQERSQTAEFYCSAANQSLRIYSYLNRTSMRAIAAMILMTYFLMNDNHASDAYSWAGIHLRQAYAMRLHRDPEIVVPNASMVEKQQRRKLWQAIFFQDTFLTILLKLPPTATHSDVPVESLADENEHYADGIDFCSGNHSRVENLMSINVIAPQEPEQPPPPLPHQTVDAATAKSDLAYQRSMWHLGNLVQENLSSPSSLNLPLANSPRHKDSLIAAFRRLYKSFPSHLTTLDHMVLQQQVITNPRAVRQNLFLNSNYYHCLMLLQASVNEEAGVECNIKGALEAAHEAVWSFVKLWALFETEAVVWWVFQHRAFEEALAICHLLSQPKTDPSTMFDPIYAKAKEDVLRVMEIMDRYIGPMEINQTRKEVLQQAFEMVPV